MNLIVTLALLRLVLFDVLKEGHVVLGFYYNMQILEEPIRILAASQAVCQILIVFLRYQQDLSKILVMENNDVE